MSTHQQPNEKKQNQLSPTDSVWQRMIEGITFARSSPSEDSLDDERELLMFLYQGLIFPKEDSLMLRVRMTGAELSSHQLLGLASIAERYGGGYADVTTRANFQIRDIAYTDGIHALRELLKLNIIPATKGLNNLRNVTVTPTTGFDVNEVIDVKPIAHRITEAILFDHALQGLPGKFNVAMDSGGSIGVASETNDLGLRAVTVHHQGADIVKFRVTFSDLRGEKTVAVDPGWLITPDQAVPLLSAAISVFLENGDFSKRLKSRIKFYISSVGLETFKSQVKARLAFTPEESKESIEGSHPITESKPARIENSHIGVWSQKQANLSYIGINGASGRYTVAQLKTLANIAKQKGSARIRLTSKQNCLLPDIAKDDIKEVLVELRNSDLSPESHFSGTIVACTGSMGCSYSATDTKSHANSLEKHLAEHLTLTDPVNIHFTGCPFSCAQAYIGDIGLLGSKIKGEACYHIFIGGGADSNLAGIKIRHAVTLDILNSEITNILTMYQRNQLCGETFLEYVKRKGSQHFINDLT